MRFHQIPSIFWERVFDVARRIRAVSSESLAVISSHHHHAESVKNAAKLAGICIHFAISMVTIIVAEKIQNHLRNTTSLLRIPSFGNISASGRINITNTTLYQVRRNNIS